MMSQYSEIQKKTLEILLEKYENSKTYLGENKVRQSFFVRPEEIFPDYASDFADMDQIRDFEHQMRALEKDGLLAVICRGGQISALLANQENWASYYRILGKKEKRVLKMEQTALYESYLGTDELLDGFCRDQLERLRNNRKAKYEPERAKHILEFCAFILRNREDILERELSIAVLGDSKLWGKSYRSAVCDILLNYGDYRKLLDGVEEKEEQRRILLEEHAVYANPSYVYFKGNAVLTFADGQTLRLNPGMPMAFTSDTLKQMKSARILDGRVMTVENLTSFHRVCWENTFYIYLGGYHNTVKQGLIRRIAEDGGQLEWRHFGDIDPDGFYIVEHLRRGTGVDFRPVYMDVETLQKYEKFAKKLEQNDLQKAQSLLESGRYQEVLAYMLRTGLKLEQEIVSWMERGG